ncbi:hypothetical protein ACO0QE_001350 [Hanseniaspora vineae]
MFTLNTPTDNNSENPLLTHTPPSATTNHRSKLFKSFSGSKVFRGEQKRQSLSSLRLDTSSVKSCLSNNRQSAINYEKLGLKIDTTPTDASFPADFDSVSEQLNRHFRARTFNHGYPKKPHVPTPLNLEMLSPPPSNSKNKDTCPPYPRNLSDLRKSDALGTHGPLRQSIERLHSPIKSFLDKETDLPKKDPRRNLFNSIDFKNAANLETTDEEFPDFAENVYRNIQCKGLNIGVCASSNVTRKRNYTMNACFICNEALNFLLPGEKVLEMSCLHQCHYDCLLASVGTSSASRERNLEYPACSICKQKSKPIEQDMNDNLIRDLLITNVNNDVLKGLNNFHVSKTNSLELEQPKKTPITPTGQLIAAQKVTQHGYMKTPVKEHHDVTKRKLGQLNHQIYGSMISRPVFSVNPQASTINVSLNSDEPLVIPHVLYVHLPETSKTKELEPNEENGQLKLGNLKIQKEFEKLVLQEFFPSCSQSESSGGVNVKEKFFGRLQMLDLMEVSFDDVSYSEWLLFMFESEIILKSLSTSKGSRYSRLVSSSSQEINISLKELHSIITCESKTFVSLKSSQLPEFYMKNTENPIVLNKWTVVMESAVNDNMIELTKKSDLSLDFLHFTTNTFDLLQERGLLPYFPAALYTQISGYLGDPIMCGKLIPKFKSESINNPFHDASIEACTKKTWKRGRSQKIGGVQVLVINVLNFNSSVSSSEMCQDIKTMIKNFLKAVEKKDRIGIIVFGRDSENKMNLYEGTFLGMINNNWAGIPEFLENLRVFDCFHMTRTHSDQEKELHKITEITKRLFFMNDISDTKSTNDDTCYKKHIHIVSTIFNDLSEEDVQGNQARISRSLKKLIREYKSDISLYSIGGTYSSLLEDVMEQHFEFDSKFRCFTYQRQSDINFCKYRDTKIEDLMIDIKLKDNKNENFKFHCLENSFGHKVQIENNKNLPAVRINLGDFAQGTFKTYMIDLVITNPRKFYVENCLNTGNKGSSDVFADDSGDLFCKSAGNFRHSQNFIEFSTNWVDKKYRLVNGDVYDSGKLIINFYGKSNVSKLLPEYDPFLNDMKLHENNEDTEFLDIVLTAPLTSSRDSIYVLREIEMMIIEVMEAHLRHPRVLNWHDLEHDFKQLYSVIFAMSRNIQIELPFFNSYMEKFQVRNKNLTNYIEYLCRVIDDIFVVDGSSTRQLKAQEELSRYKLLKLLNNLKFQNRHNI